MSNLDEIIHPTGDREAGTLFEIPSDLLRGHTGLEPMKFKG